MRCTVRTPATCRVFLLTNSAKPSDLSQPFAHLVVLVVFIGATYSALIMMTVVSESSIDDTFTGQKLILAKRVYYDDTLD